MITVKKTKEGKEVHCETEKGKLIIDVRIENGYPVVSILGTERLSDIEWVDGEQTRPRIIGNRIQISFATEVQREQYLMNLLKSISLYNEMDCAYPRLMDAPVHWKTLFDEAINAGYVKYQHKNPKKMGYYLTKEGKKLLGKGGD